ncbi:MAG: hypothetical protein WBA46_17005 [Thermomicrobiales bacterium]
MLKRIADNLEAIRAVCRRFGVLRLETYEDSAYDEADPEWSPVRFLVDLGAGDDANPWHSIDLALALEGEIGRFVVLTERRLVGDQRLLASTVNERVTIYDSRKQQAAA